MVSKERKRFFCVPCCCFCWNHVCLFKVALKCTNIVKVYQVYDIKHDNILQNVLLLKWRFTQVSCVSVMPYISLRHLSMNQPNTILGVKHTVNSCAYFFDCVDWIKYRNSPELGFSVRLVLDMVLQIASEIYNFVCFCEYQCIFHSSCVCLSRAQRERKEQGVWVEPLALKWVSHHLGQMQGSERNSSSSTIKSSFHGVSCVMVLQFGMGKTAEYLQHHQRFACLQIGYHHCIWKEERGFSV